jgi:hypothetical protein
MTEGVPFVDPIADALGVPSTVVENHKTAANNLPAGGHTWATGIEIDWQDGPLVGADGKRREPSGAFVEDVVKAALGRMRFYQTASGGRFACRENACAITHLQEALFWMHQRTADRVARKVEGTHQV